jgi:hypothetical protein
MNFVVQGLNLGANKWCMLLRGSECTVLSLTDAAIIAAATLLACFLALVVVSTGLAIIREN